MKARLEVKTSTFSVQRIQFMKDKLTSYAQRERTGAEVKPSGEKCWNSGAECQRSGVEVKTSGAKYWNSCVE